MCLVGSLLSLPAWWLARSPFVALAANLVIDLFGALPTVRKTHQAPGEESLLAWSVFLAADVVNLGALGLWSLATAIYPLYLLALAGVMVLLMVRPSVIRIAAAART